ncbi:MAG: type II secretion system protein [Patescibacteria group bacterium]
MKNNKGFTIVELILYMGILSVLLSILVSIFVTALDVQLESEAASSVERDGTYILAKLSYDIHRASSISIPASLGSQTNNFKIVVGGVDYTYGLDGSENLTLNNNLGTNNLNSYDSKVSGLLAKRLGNAGGVEDTLKINFTITSRTKRTGTAGYEAKDFETNLSLRKQ